MNSIRRMGNKWIFESVRKRISYKLILFQSADLCMNMGSAGKREVETLPTFIFRGGFVARPSPWRG